MNQELKGLIPEIINNFALYKGEVRKENKFLGVTGEVVMPDLQNMTETISGAGILGEIEAANPGHYSNIDMEIPFIGLCNDVLQFSETETTNLTMRMVQQSTVKDSREKSYKGLVVSVGGTRKALKIGTVKIGGQMGSSVTLAVNYIKIATDECTLFELDKYNETYVLNGKDQLKKITDLC